MNLANASSIELSCRMLDDALLEPMQDASQYHLFLRLKDSAQRQNLHFHWNAALEHWGELVRLGAVAILGTYGGYVNASEPTFVVTARGKALLAGAETSAYDSTRYLLTLRKRVPRADSIALSYVDEAIGAWKAGLYRASAVMLGCACERLALMLAEHVRVNDLAPYSKNLESMTKPGKVPSITDVFTQVRGGIVAAAEDKRLPGDLAPDIIDRRLSSVFEHVRVLRNTSGHPTGERVSAEEAEAGLLLFPGFHELTSRILSELKPKGERHG